MRKIVINKVVNSGLDIREPVIDKKDYCSELFKEAGEPMLGAVSPLRKPKIVFKNGKGWLKVARDYGLPEIQFNKEFDTFSCVVYAIAKSTCYYMFKVYGIKITISEMLGAFFAGVVKRRGTSIRKGMEGFRKNGWVSDEDYPFTRDTTSEEFFTTPPKHIILKAKGELTKWNFHWEVLPCNIDAIFEQYKRTPVVLTGFAWASYFGEGVYHDYNNAANHAFAGLEKAEFSNNNMCDDTYPKDFAYKDNPMKDELIKELHESFNYGSAHFAWVTPTEDNNKISIKYIINMFKKIARDIHGGFWFLKSVGGATHKQKITGWKSMLGSIIDEIGVEKNDLSDSDLAAMPDGAFFK